MRNGFQVFDADAHVIYPADLWSRFLDKRFRDRIGRQGPRRVRPLQPGHRRRPLVAAPHVDLRQLPEGDQLDHRRHDRQVRPDSSTEGFTGDRVADRARSRGRRRDGDLRTRVRHVARRHRPRAPGRDGTRVQPVGPGDARAVERRGDHVRPGAAQRRHARGAGDPVRARRSSVSTASGPGPTSSTTATSATATTTRSTSCCRISTARSRRTSTWASTRSTAGSDRFNDVHRVAHRRAPARGAERAAVDDRARACTSGSRACAPPTWKPAAVGCRAGCTASTSTSSSRARWKRPSSR